MELVFLRENGDIPDVFNITFKETTVWNYSIIKVIRFFIFSVSFGRYTCIPGVEPGIERSTLLW